MARVLHSIRRAEPADAAAIADVHAESWREAYRGIIPGRRLEAMIARRGKAWWRRAIVSGARLIVCEFEGEIVGYASVGASRARFLPYSGEIFELYLIPRYQGLGFGARLFRAAQEELRQSGRTSFVVWALGENARALRFYERLGGVEVWRAPERFDNEVLARVAFGFSAP